MHYGRQMTRVHASQDLIGIGGHQPATKEPPYEPAEKVAHTFLRNSFQNLREEGFIKVLMV